jgi:hypothetical protein
MKNYTMNDRERSLWIDNDEGLYRWWKSTRQSKTRFIRENRKEIGDYIVKALNVQPR